MGWSLHTKYVQQQWSYYFTEDSYIIAGYLQVLPCQNVHLVGRAVPCENCKFLDRWTSTWCHYKALFIGLVVWRWLWIKDLLAGTANRARLFGFLAGSWCSLPLPATRWLQPNFSWMYWMQYMQYMQYMQNIKECTKYAIYADSCACRVWNIFNLCNIC